MDAAESQQTLEQENEFIGRLRYLASIAGSANALAKKAGISPSGLQRYLNGGDPTRKVLVALAKATGVNLNWLATGEGSPTGAAEPVNDNKASLTRMPLYKVDAAETASATDFMIIHDGRTTLPGLAFCRNWLGKQGLEARHLAGLQARGNSMEPTIRNAESILIDLEQREIIDGEIYVIRDDNSFLIKRLQRQLAGKLRMLCDNPMYPVIESPETDIKVVGRVVWRGSLL